MTVGIGVGLANSFPFSGPAGFWRWIELCEEGDIDSFWQNDRLVSKETILECMSAMAAVAGATKRLKFGMSVASVGLRDPLLLAKQCATIDFLSGGRLLPAFGIGTTRSPDWTTTGRPTEGRGKRTDEGLEIIARLWRGETLTFAGEYYNYDGARIAPLPVQKAIPLWIGGSTDAAVRRTARYGTGWLAAFETPEEAGSMVQRIKQATAAQGRSIDEDHYGAGFSFRFGNWGERLVGRAATAYETRTKRDPKNQFVVGDASDIQRRIAAYVEHGVSKFVLRPLADGDDDVMAQTLRLINEVLPDWQKKDIAPGTAVAV